VKLAAAILLALLISLLGFVLLGVFIPVWSMEAIYGVQQVQDSPGHGGVNHIATLPLAGILCAAGFVFLVLFFRKKISRLK
jgi:hypothetical protein